MTPLLYVALSYHGFGHIAQTAPVVNALSRRLPGLRVFVQCAAPKQILQTHFHCRFEHLQKPTDLGMAMANSLDVQVEASHAAYVEFHRNWKQKVASEAQRLRAIGPSLVLANVPYLCIAAAAEAHIPSVVIGSLNWAEIFYAYCQAMPHAKVINEQIREAYAQAKLFLNPTPSMPMPGLSNTRRIGPIARLGSNQRLLLNQRLNLAPGDRLVLIFLGGIPTELEIGNWPSLRGINLVIDSAASISRPGIFPLQATGLPYIDALSSVDALITKPGYGSLVEAACNGVPVLYTRRDHWPEEPSLISWLREQVQCLELGRTKLERGEFGELLQSLWRQPQGPAPVPTGIAEATELLESYLR